MKTARPCKTQGTRFLYIDTNKAYAAPAIFPPEIPGQRIASFHP